MESVHTSEHEEVINHMTQGELEAFIQDQSQINRRNFNVHDINGRFIRDKMGKIVDRE